MIHEVFDVVKLAFLQLIKFYLLLKNPKQIMTLYTQIFPKTCSLKV